MKHIKQLIEEDTAAVPGGATPANTMGMGNPVAPDGDTPGSEPLTAKLPNPYNKKKKHKKEQE